MRSGWQEDEDEDEDEAKENQRPERPQGTPDKAERYSGGKPKGPPSVVQPKAFEECPHCFPGSGKAKGHIGRHNLKGRHKAASPAPTPAAAPAPAPAAAAARSMALPKRQSRAPMREDFVDITQPGLSLASPKGGMSAAAMSFKPLRGAERTEASDVLLRKKTLGVKRRGTSFAAKKSARPKQVSFAPEGQLVNVAPSGSGKLNGHRGRHTTQPLATAAAAVASPQAVGAQPIAAPFVTGLQNAAEFCALGRDAEPLRPQAPPAGA